MNTKLRISGFCAALAIASAAGAASPPKKPALKPRPAGEAAAPQQPRPATPPKSPGTRDLDDLLGIPRPDSGVEGETFKDDADARLKQQGPQPSAQFQEAVALMERSSRRINDGKDVGIETQRLQEDAVRKLDALISQLQKQQKSQQQQKQEQQDPQNQQGENQPQPQQQAGEGEKEETKGGDGKKTDLPGRRDGALRPTLDTARSAWGALPARIREMLLQGTGEKFSTAYERMTEEYYKKLAEKKP